jgi:hypothetical protein
MVIKWPFKRRVPMFAFIKTEEERIADEIKKIETEAEAKKAEIKAKVKADENKAKEYIVGVWDDAIHNIELGLTDAGLLLDKEADDALAVIKHKLSDFKDTLEPQIPASPIGAGDGYTP